MTNAGRASDESPDESQDIGSDGQLPSSDGPQTDTSQPDLISRRAYERFQLRGSEHGRDQDDWLEAERELKARDE